MVASTGAALHTAGFLTGFRHGFWEVVGLLFQHFDVLTEKALNTNEITRFRFVAKRVGKAIFSGAPCSANAVNVDLWLVGEIEIEHVGDVVNVDTTTGDVRGHENEHIAVLESVKRSRSCSLALVSVD